MKRCGFKRPAHEPSYTHDRESRIAARTERMAAMFAGVQPRASVMGGVSGVAVVKAPRNTSRTAGLIHKGRLAELGCMACLRLHGPHAPGPVELHHLRGGGWGKGDWTTLIPLCVAHHRGPLGVHGMGTKAFDAHYGFTQADLLADARRLTNWGA